MYCSASDALPVFNLHINCPTLVNVNPNISKGKQYWKSPFSFAYSGNSAINVFFKYAYDEPVYLSSMFNGCFKFNGSVDAILNKFPNAYCLSGFLYAATNYNRSIIIPDVVTDCSFMLTSCRNFNAPIKLGNNVTNAYYMFYNCPNFNSSVIASPNLSNCVSMFGSCSNFRPSSLVLPNTITNSYNMFAGCFGYASYHTPSIIFNGFNSDANISGTFKSANNINITINSDITDNMSAGSFFQGYLYNSNITIQGNLSFNGSSSLSAFITFTSAENSTITCRGHIHNYLCNFPTTPSVRYLNNLHIETTSLSSALMAEKSLFNNYSNGTIRTRGEDLTNNNGYTYVNTWYYSDSGFEFVPYYSSYSQDRYPTVFVNY